MASNCKTIYHNSKSYLDPIHGEIQFSELVGKIIETKEFKRLKEIKQLGFAYTIFPEANHTRYEHCIGTYFVAKKMVDSLSENLNFEIPESYKICVCIAGLLHDIGHGPFSHYWEHINKDYQHEENCNNLVERIFKYPKIEKCGINKSIDVELIKAFITGEKSKLSTPIDPKYEFLFDIVNNKKCDIDVDKWDYLLRDFHYTKKYLRDVNININFENIFTDARVTSDHKHIMYNRQHFENIVNLFDTRSKLHLEIYQHLEVKIKENLFSKVIEIFNNKGHKFQGLNLLEINGRCEKEFLYFTDNNVLQIMKDINDDEIQFYLSEFAKKNITNVQKKQRINTKKMRIKDIPFYDKLNKEKEIIPI